MDPAPSFVLDFSELRKIAALRRDLIGYALAKTASIISKLPVSPGYEPYLVQKGLSVSNARATAALIRSRGLRIFKEQQARTEVLQSIRYLARSKRFGKVAMRHAERVLAFQRENKTIFQGFEHETHVTAPFLDSLHAVVRGDLSAGVKLSSSAAALATKLPNPAGRKPKLAAITHEVFVEFATKVLQGSDAKPIFCCNDMQGRATDAEFGLECFDSRPITRRRKRHDN